MTARDPAVVADSSARLVPVPCYSQREAVAALMGWLSTDPDHRSGQLDLALALGCEPAAIAQAGAVISTAELTCRQYHEQFLRRKAAIEADTGREVPAAVVTWVMSAEHAEILEPGAGTWPLLVMASLLSPHGIPLAVLTSRAACRYLAGSDGSGSAAPERVEAAVAALQAAGLLAVDGSGPLPVAQDERAASGGGPRGGAAGAAGAGDSRHGGRAGGVPARRRCAVGRGRAATVVRCGFARGGG